MPNHRTIARMSRLAALMILAATSIGHAQSGQIEKLSQFVMVDYRQGAGTKATLIKHHRDFLLTKYLGQNDPHGHPMTPQRFVLYVSHPGLNSEYKYFYDPRDTVPATGPCMITAPTDVYRFVDFLESVGRNFPGVEIELFFGNGSITIESGSGTPVPITNATWQCPITPPPSLPIPLEQALDTSGKFKAAPAFMQWLDALNTTMNARGSSASPAFENPIKGITFDPEGLNIKEVISTSLVFDNLKTQIPGLQQLRLGSMPGYSEITTAKALTSDFPASSWPVDLKCATISPQTSNWALFNTLLTANEGLPNWRSASDTSAILDSAYIQVYNDCGVDQNQAPQGPVKGSLYLWQNEAVCGDVSNRTPRAPDDASRNLLNTLRNIPTINGPGTMSTTQSGPNDVTMMLDVPQTLPPGQAKLDFTIINQSSSIYISSTPSGVPSPITSCINWETPSSTSCTGASGTSDLLPYCLPLKVGQAMNSTTALGSSCSSGEAGTPSHDCTDLNNLVQYPYLFNEVGANYRIPTITSESHERIFFMFSAEQGDGRLHENGGNTPFFGIWSYSNFLAFTDRFQSQSGTLPFYNVNVTATCADGPGNCAANEGMPAIRPTSTTLPYSNFAIYDLYFACKAWNIADYPGGYTSSACPADLNLDGSISGEDLTILLGSWGQTCVPGDGACDADLTGDLSIDGADLTILLGAWGVCP